MTSQKARKNLRIRPIGSAATSAHAVRELIADALDEQVLSDTREVGISKDPEGSG
jgi:hypothetical protein